jgi:hypothetical protein
MFDVTNKNNKLVTSNIHTFGGRASKMSKIYTFYSFWTNNWITYVIVVIMIGHKTHVFIIVNQIKTCKKTNAKKMKVKQETKYDKVIFNIPIMWCILFWRLLLHVSVGCNLVLSNHNVLCMLHFSNIYAFYNNLCMLFDRTKLVTLPL